MKTLYGKELKDGAELLIAGAHALVVNTKDRGLWVELSLCSFDRTNQDDSYFLYKSNAQCLLSRYQHEVFTTSCNVKSLEKVSNSAFLAVFRTSIGDTVLVRVDEDSSVPDDCLMGVFRLLTDYPVLSEELLRDMEYAAREESWENAVVDTVYDFSLYGKSALMKWLHKAGVANIYDYDNNNVESWAAWENATRENMLKAFSACDEVKALHREWLETDGQYSRGDKFIVQEEMEERLQGALCRLIGKRAAQGHTAWRKNWLRLPNM